MPFKKNDKNINKEGRPANPDQTLERLLSLMSRLRFHPGRELLRMYRNPMIKDELKAKILMELLSYAEGKKAISKDPEGPPKPLTPEESKRNAEKQAELIKALEADAQKKPE